MRELQAIPPRACAGRGTAAAGGGGGASSDGLPTLQQRARQLRKTMSPPEIRLWQELRQRPHGFIFRRQRRTDPYILDFFCRAAALAIEVDGDAHDFEATARRDVRRDQELLARGIKVLRVPAVEVMRNLEGVLAQVLQECASRTPSTTLRAVPLPTKSRGGS